MLLVYRYRIKSLTGLLNSQARACNFVWNFCNDTQLEALKWNKRWPSGFDLNRLTAGSSKDLALHAVTINAVCEQYAKSRRQRNRPFLRWRGRRSLGWVPLKGRDLKREGQAFRFAGNTFRVFHSRPLPEGKIKDGTNFSCDARGHWFLNIVVEVAAPKARPVRRGIGIDLGLKDFAALSTGQKIENPRFLRQLADKLATAQRARKRRQARNIYARIANARGDFHYRTPAEGIAALYLERGGCQSIGPMFGMRFDLRAPGMTPAEIAREYRAAIDMAQWGDEKGAMNIGLSEHHCSEDGYLPAPLILAAAMAAVTRNVQIIVAAALLPMYDAVRLAEEMIVLDYVSQGRVSYVLGIGYRPVEYELYQLDYEERGAIADRKLEQLLDVLRRASEATAMPRVTPGSFTPGRPRIMWGGATKAAARRAGRNGLPFFAQTNTPGLAETYTAAAREAGFEPGQCLLPSPEMPSIVFVHPDPDIGWKEVGPYLLADATAYAEWNKDANRPTVSLSKGKTVEALRAEGGAHRVVDVAGAIALVKRWGRLPLHPLCGGCPPDLAWTYLRRVADQVLPALAHQGG